MDYSNDFRQKNLIWGEGAAIKVLKQSGKWLFNCGWQPSKQLLACTLLFIPD